MALAWRAYFTAQGAAMNKTAPSATEMSPGAATDGSDISTVAHPANHFRREAAKNEPAR